MACILEFLQEKETLNSFALDISKEGKEGVKTVLVGLNFFLSHIIRIMPCSW